MTNPRLFLPGIIESLETRCRAVARDTIAAQYVVRELLAELDAPLVEGIDAPQNSEHERLVLVERDQLAEMIGVELADQDAVARPVAAEAAMRGERARRAGFHLRPAHLRLRLRGALAEHQRLALRQEVGGQQPMKIRMAGAVARRQDEVAEHPLRALVDQLVEGVLAVGPGLAEQDRASRAFHRLAIAARGLAVA